MLVANASSNDCMVIIHLDENSPDQQLLQVGTFELSIKTKFSSIPLSHIGRVGKTSFQDHLAGRALSYRADLVSLKRAQSLWQR